MKKFFAFLLTFAMLFSLAMPAMAAEGDSLSTIYIDVGQLEEAASVQSVYFYTKPDNLVSNEPMTHVSGTIYSYDISAAVAGGATYVEFETFSGDGETLLGSYYTANFETGKNMWTATGRGSGTWSTYNPTGGITINGNTTGDVSASYTPSSTEDTTAKITGLYITVDGVKYDSSTAEAPVTIYSDSTVTVTVYGENFANLPVYGNQTSGFTYFGSNAVYLFEDTSEWSIDPVSNTATYTANHEILAKATTASELKYTNDFSATQLGSGIYVIYNEGTKPTDTTAKITGVTITVDGVTYDSGDVTIYSDSTVTLNIHGTNLQNATDDNRVYYGYYKVTTVGTTYGFTITDDGTVATRTFPASDFSESYNTSIFYSNNNTASSPSYVYPGITLYYNAGTKPQPTYTVTIDESIGNGTVTVDKATAAEGETVTVTVEAEAGYAYAVGSLTVTNSDGDEIEVNEDAKTFVMPASDVTVTASFEKLSVTSAEITWGSMSFTYDDTIDETTNAEKGWSDSDTGWVTVKNTGNTTFTAQASYESTTAEYGTFTGTFDPASSELTAGNSYTFTLELNGKPTKAIPAGTKIGEVTITINESAEG